MCDWHHAGRRIWLDLAAQGLLLASLLASRLTVADAEKTLQKDIFFSKSWGSPRERQLMQELRLWGSKDIQVSNRVVAAMTTTPTRIQLIERVVDSLLNQSRPLDAVYLFVPHVFLRDGSQYVLPPWLQQKAAAENFHLRRCEDSGPATHMQEVLKLELDPNTYILQVDDDQEYGRKLVESLLKATSPLPGRAIGAATQHAYSYLNGPVMEGVHGVLFPRKFFDSSVFDYAGFSEYCKLHDDLWLSAHLARKGRRREALTSRFGAKPLSFGFRSDALFQGGAGTDNHWNFFACMSSLMENMPTLWDPEDRVAVVAPLAGSRAQDASQALRRLLRRLQRKPGFGPHALYLFGNIADAESLFRKRPGKTPEMTVPGGFSTTLRGPSGLSMDLVFQGCGVDAPCSWATTLRTVLQFEEDPATVIVLSDGSDANVEAVLEEHQRCLGSEATLRVCRASDGSSSFRRIAAYSSEDPLRTAAFMPYFSSHQWVASERPPAEKVPDFGAAYWAAFKLLVAHDTSIATTVRGWLSERRRIVGVLLASGQWRHRTSRIMSSSSRSLLRQRPRLARLYVFVQSRGARRGCSVPGYLRNRQRIRLVCSYALTQLWETLLQRELWPATLILMGGARRHAPNLLPDLLKAFHLWGAAAVASRAIGGPEPWPLLDWGFIFQRSFLDSRVLDIAACARHPEVVVANFYMKGVGLRVLGSSQGSTGGRGQLTPSFATCRSSLPSAVEPSFAFPPERRVLFVVLPVHFMLSQLDLALRLVALQTRLPDDVVLAASDEDKQHGGDDSDPPSQKCLAFAVPVLQICAEVLAKITESPTTSLPPGLVELDVMGELAGSMSLRRHGRQLNVSLKQMLPSMLGKAGVVLRYQRPREPETSYVLSALSCGSGPSCRAQSLLAQAFARESEPGTGLHFSSADRLVNYKLMEIYEASVDCSWAALRLAASASIRRAGAVAARNLQTRTGPSMTWRSGELLGIFCNRAPDAQRM
eukprot:s216_g20.t2